MLHGANVLFDVCRVAGSVLTCFGFRFARCRAAGARTGRYLGAAAAVGVFLHVCLRTVSGVEAELRAESGRAL